ncbi:MAG TPA: hypothetical protein VF723_00680 [Pyrinomonadaceae bacterium]|jgi:hypothetical protein
MGKKITGKRLAGKISIENVSALLLCEMSCLKGLVSLLSGFFMQGARLDFSFGGLGKGIPSVRQNPVPSPKLNI